MAAVAKIGPFVPALHEERQRPRVIDVRVREDDGDELFYGDGEMGVAFDRFTALALEEAAVEEDGAGLRAKEMH